MGHVDSVPLPAAFLDRLAGLGLVVEVDRTKSRLSTAEYFAIFHALAPIAPRDLGLRMGEDTSEDGSTIASRAAMHAPNLREAIDRMARYKRLVCPEEITLHIVRGEARVRFEWLLTDEPPPPLLIDAIMARLLVLARRGTAKPIVPRRITLTRRRRDEAMLRRHFGCPIEFDAPADVFVFAESDLALPFVTHDPTWSASFVSTVDPPVAQRSVADEVVVALGRGIGERPAVAKVARELGMSTRTLQRRLGELGTSYQDVLDDVRRRSARRLLAETDLDSGEVAFLLGFEELNSFTRAFHAWEGTTPLRWRATERKSP